MLEKRELAYVYVFTTTEKYCAFLESWFSSCVAIICNCYKTLNFILPSNQDTKTRYFQYLRECVLLGVWSIACGLSAGQQCCPWHIFFFNLSFVVLTIPCNLSMQFRYTFLALSNNNNSLEIFLKTKAHL